MLFGLRVKGLSEGLCEKLAKSCGCSTFYPLDSKLSCTG